jgi:hypothetical protein
MALMYNFAKPELVACVFPPYDLSVRFGKTLVSCTESEGDREGMRSNGNTVIVFRFANCVEFDSAGDAATVTHCSAGAFRHYDLRHHRPGIVLRKDAHDVLLQRNR